MFLIAILADWVGAVVASVNVQVGFQRFLNLGNLWKPLKTQEPRNLDTHVPFPRNLTNIYMVGTMETYRNLINLLIKNFTKEFQRISMYVKREKMII